MISRYEEVIPSDEVSFKEATAGILVGYDIVNMFNRDEEEDEVPIIGDIKVTMADGGIVTFPDVRVGVLPIRVTRVWDTGTTATNIIAVYEEIKDE